jgi:hypothetical protein
MPHDDLTLEQAEALSFEEWEKLPMDVRNRIIRAYYGNDAIEPERAYPNQAINGRKGGRKGRKRKKEVEEIQ